MSIRRIVPNIASSDPDLSRDFYADFLGLRQAMNLGWIATYVSPSNPTAQVSVAKGLPAGTPQSAVSITVEVEDVDALHAAAGARGLTVVYPLTDEPWGVRRFAVLDPNGVPVNLMQHLAAAKS